MNKIKQFIESLEKDVFPFKPNRRFYKTVGINQKRFSQLMRNEADATISELQNIGKYFECSISDLIIEN